MSNFNGLNPAEAERIAILMEECGEVIQACGKILRHGFESRHPDGGPSNRDELDRELTDLHAAIYLVRSADVPEDMKLGHLEAKYKSLKKYTHHQNWEVYATSNACTKENKHLSFEEANALARKIFIKGI